MAKISRWSIKVNSLWLWWYCALVVGTEAYLMYRAVNKCQEYNELPWPSDMKPVSELYAYISFIVISIMCIPFFILTCFCKVGNYAGDGMRLGRDDVMKTRGSCSSTPSGSTQDVGGSTGLVTDGTTVETLMKKDHGSNSRLMTYWRHCGPLSNSFHILAAFSLLLPNILLDARKIQHGFLEPGAIWQTELGVFEDRETSVTLHVGVSSFTRNNSLGQTPSPTAIVTKVTSHVDVVSPEFINYVLALIINSIRYPAVYWYSKMAFSLVFSFMLLLTTAHYVVSYCISAVLYKLTLNSKEWFPNVALVLTPSAGIILYIFASTIMFLSAISIFNYGYLHYNEAHKTFLRRHRKSGRLSPPPTGCQGYFPHTIATVSLVLFVALRGPMVYDSVTVYRNFNHPIALASIVFDVSYMLIWISLWFCFTIKQEWSFKILAFTVHSSISVSDIFTIQNDHIRESTNSLNGPLPNGHVGSGIAAENKKPKKKKSKASADHSFDSNSQYPGFEIGLGSPTSALRKSGERKQNRVTFEDSRDENDGPNAMLRNGPERSSKERDIPAQVSNEGGSRGSTLQGTPVNLKRKFKRELAARIHNAETAREDNNDGPNDGDSTRDVHPERKISRNLFGDFELSETPENTLKRNYRNSLRSKCGQYYRNSREFTSPPAAQSSPVLPAKHATERSGVRDKSPNNAPQNTSGFVSVPPTRPPARNTSPGRPPVRKERYPSPQRAGYTSYSNPALNDNNYNDAGRLTNTSSSHTNSYSSGLNSQDSRNYPQLPYQGPQSYSNAAFQSNSPHRSMDLPTHLPPRPPQNSAVKHARQHSGRGMPQASRTKTPPNREIQIADSKPEMGRRDSALPSSNETSSNDSQDVLCSQV